MNRLNEEDDRLILCGKGIRLYVFSYSAGFVIFSLYSSHYMSFAHVRGLSPFAILLLHLINTNIGGDLREQILDFRLIRKFVLVTDASSQSV